MVVKRYDEDWVERRNKAVMHYIWTIFLSMITAIVVTLAVTGKIP